MGRFLGITGTPGTGKKTLAPPVAKVLGLPCVSLNEFLTPSECAKDSLGVDPRRLRTRLLGRTRGRNLVFGHMIPDVLRMGEVEKVVVLRCNPSVLRLRLRRRRYPAEKVAGNVEAELIGVVAAACISRFGRRNVAEFDTTASGVRSSVDAVSNLLQASGIAGAPVDWVPLYSSAEKLRSLLSEASTDSAFT